MSRVAIYIPTYNAEALVEQTVRSCLQQTSDDFHVYIVDNCSTDNTLEKIAACIRDQGAKEKVTVIKNKKNLGRVGNWNNCLDLFRNSPEQYLKFLFTGDELKPTCLEEQLRIFEQGKTTLGLVTCATINEKDGQEAYFSLLSEEGPLAKAQSLTYAIERGCWFGSSVSCALIKKEYVPTAFDPLYAWAADFKFWVDIAAQCDSYYLKEALTVFHYAGRKFYSTQVTKLRSRVEVKMVRYHALDLLRENTTTDKATLARLETFLEQGDDLIPLSQMPEIAGRKLLHFVQGNKS